MSAVERTVRALQTIADYQFGAGAGAALFPMDDPPEIRRSTSGRPTQVVGETGRLVTLGRDGRFTLGYAGGRRLAAVLEAPAYRVAVGDESEPHVCAGENAFAKFVRATDSKIRPGDEVMVVHDRAGDLLAVGRAELSAGAMGDFQRGVAVSVREGRDEWRDRR